MSGNEHAGHRKRLLSKLESDTLEDHEYLEALLFNAIPRMNTNETAHRLLARFGSLSGVFSASVAELSTVKGMGENAATYLCLVGKVFRAAGKGDKQEKTRFPRVFNEEEFVTFLKRRYAGAKVEYLDCFLIDGAGKIKAMETFTSQEERLVDVNSEEIGRIISASSPYGVVFAHNHLIGDSNPTEQDEDATCKMQMLCSMHNARLCDHYIVSPNGVYSYHTSGKLQEISKNFSINKVIEVARKKSNRVKDKLF